MSTAEYAVGTVAACAFAAVLYRVVSGESIVTGLTDLVESALATLSCAVRPRRRRTAARESGMVTAETAVVLPVLLLVLAGAVAVVVVVGAQLRCVDAAREGARAAARGEPPAAVAEIVRRAAPAGAAVSVTRNGDEVRVAVAVDVAPLGPVPLRIRVAAEAVALLEPGAQDGAG